MGFDLNLPPPPKRRRVTAYYNEGGQRRQAKTMTIHDDCRSLGCRYLEACTIEYKAKETLALSEGKAMSQALWCDDHDGPFSAKDPDQQTVTRTSRDADGNEITEQFTQCGGCAGLWKLSVEQKRTAIAPKATDASGGPIPPYTP
jgi:hypothetical protein